MPLHTFFLKFHMHLPFAALIFRKILRGSFFSHINKRKRKIHQKGLLKKGDKKYGKKQKNRKDRLELLALGCAGTAIMSQKQTRRKRRGTRETKRKESWRRRRKRCPPDFLEVPYAV